MLAKIYSAAVYGVDAYQVEIEVKGVLPVALEARRRGKRSLFVPEANAREAAMVGKIDVYGVRNLRETFQFLRGEIPLLPTHGDLTRFFAAHQDHDVDFSDVKGQ